MYPGVLPRLWLVISLEKEPFSQQGFVFFFFSFWLPTPVFLGFPGGSDGKESTCIVGGLALIPGLGRSPERGHGN